MNLIDKTEVSSLGLGSRPDKRTIISNDQISKLFTIQNQENFKLLNTNYTDIKKKNSYMTVRLILKTVFQKLNNKRKQQFWEKHHEFSSCPVKLTNICEVKLLLNYHCLLSLITKNPWYFLIYMIIVYIKDNLNVFCKTVLIVFCKVKTV